MKVYAAVFWTPGTPILGERNRWVFDMLLIGKDAGVEPCRREVSVDFLDGDAVDILDTDQPVCNLRKVEVGTQACVVKVRE